MAGWGGAAQALLAYVGSVRRAHGRGPGIQDLAGGDRHLPGGAARPNPHRQAGGQPRPHLERPLSVRHWRRLEPRGDGRPRNRVRNALQADARTSGGDEGDLDPGGGGISRRARELRADLVLAETRPAATSAGPSGWQWSQRAEAGRRLRGRMDAEPGRGPTPNPGAAGAPQGGRSWPPPGDDLSDR